MKQRSQFIVCAALLSLPGCEDGETIDINNRNGDPSTQQYEQVIYRNNRGYRRAVPMLTDGSPNWSAASQVWHTSGLLPGSGDATSATSITDEHGVIQEFLWRGGSLYQRSRNGSTTIANWHKVAIQDDLPGTGAVTSFSIYPTGPNTMEQSFWKGSVGYNRTFNPASWPAWSASWGNAISNTDTAIAAVLPEGARDVVSQAEYAAGSTLTQDVWQECNSSGQCGYSRTIPLSSSGVPQWANGGTWQGPFFANQIPVGSGEIQGQSTHVVATDGSNGDAVFVQLRTYIPCDTVWAPTPQADPYFNGGTKSLQVLRTVPGSSAVTTLANEFYETRSYGNAHAEAATPWWCNGTPLTPIYNRGTEPVTDDSLSTGLSSTTSDNGGSTTLFFEVSGSNPVALLAPRIDASLSVTVAADGSYEVSGWHDGFPAYELMLNGEVVYTHNPLETGSSPTSLFPPMEVEAVASGYLD